MEFIYLGDRGGEILKKLHGEYFSSRIPTLIADENTLPIAEALASVLPGKPKVFSFPKGKPFFIPRWEEVERLSREIENFSLPISVGSGSITDVVRYVSFRKKIPFISYPTAPSMNGYTSSVSALFKDEFKLTLPAAPPWGVVVDLKVVHSAPEEMIRAGFGDLLSRFVAPADWILGKEIRGEAFCPLIFRFLGGIEESLRRIAPGIKEKKEEAIKELMELLLFSGLLMSLSGSSRPFSGAEHLISHFWDITSPSEKWSLHGLQVAVGTRAVSLLWEKIVPRKIEEVLGEEEEEGEESIRRIYGERGEMVIEIYRKKHRKSKGEERERILQRWERILREVKGILREEKILQALYEKSGCPGFPQGVGKSKDDLRRALLYSSYLRDRYTVLDLLRTLGSLKRLTEEVIAELPEKHED